MTTAPRPEKLPALPQAKFWLDSMVTDKFRPENLAYMAGGSTHVSTVHTVRYDEPYYTAEQMRAYALEALAAREPGENRLLNALERAGSAECALRRLVDECDNDGIVGWEDRMAACIAHANDVLSAHPPVAAQVSEGVACADEIAAYIDSRDPRVVELPQLKRWEAALRNRHGE